MSAVPVLKDELDRKSFETMEWLLDSLERQRISPAQYSTGVDALFMAVNGLVDEGVNDIISVASPNTVYAVDRAVLLKGPAAVAVSCTFGRDTVTAVGYENGVIVTTKVKDYDSPAAAREAKGKTIKALLDKGYVEI